jgi:nucleoid-associated protein YgaU
MCTAFHFSPASAHLRALAALGFAFVSLGFLGAPTLRAQSTDSQQNPQGVAEAARQARARKQRAAARRHVYTNEDLRREKILTREDQSRAAAAKQKPQPLAPVPPATQSLDANSASPREPLGDVARRYRNAKKISPFHLPTDQRELAAPKILAPIPPLLPNATPPPQPPVRGFAPVNPSAPIRRAPSVSAPSLAPVPSHRIDPFLRRRFQPLPPAIAIRPVEPGKVSRPNLPAPNLSTKVRSELTLRARPSLPAGPAHLIVVRPGDTLWNLSRRHLGRGARWLEITVVNPNLSDPNRLVPGTTLVLPPRTTRHSAAQVPSSIKVHAGDTLSQIALDTYGRASYWPCIAHANPSLSNPNRIAIGQFLSLPSACAP